MLRNSLVTGAARGIGRAIALRLANDGLNVAVVDRKVNAGELESVRKEIDQVGRRSVAIIGDVSVSKSVEQMMKDAAEKLGSLDVMVANAGICGIRALVDMTVEEWDNMFAVNMRGVFLCYKEAAKIMIKQGSGGKIIGASSSAGYIPAPMISHYGATKWGVRSLTQTAALELAPHKITVNTYCPGFIETNMTDDTNKEFAKLQGKTETEIRETYRTLTPLGRLGCPDDVAHLVSFLASKQADYITGQSILVNGGMCFS